MNSGLPEEGTDAATLLASTAEQLFEHSLFNGHPRFFGYITSSPAPIGILGDLVASAVNPNVGAWPLSPAASEIEAQTIRWIAEFIGYPTDCGGLLVSGGNMANFVCFLAARAARAGWDVRRDGLAGSSRQLVVYASAETHTWIQKATDLAGLGTASIRWIPTHDDFRMDVTQLERRIESDVADGHIPFIVDRDGWFSEHRSRRSIARDRSRVPRPEHLVSRRWRLRRRCGRGDWRPGGLHAMSLADSVAVDPHKWLYAPIEAGCVLVRDAGALRACVLVSPRLLPPGRTRHQLRRLRATELPWVSCPQGLAGTEARGSRGVPSDDRRRHGAVTHHGRRRRTRS